MLAHATLRGAALAAGLRMVQTYQPGWLRNDIVAGLVLTAVLVPVGMAYAEASGLPPITGLYATILPLIAYAMVGPSRILVLGPDSSLAGIIAAVVIPMSPGDPARAIALAGALSIITGMLCIAAGLLKFGFLTDLLSKPVRYGLRQRHRADGHRRPIAQALRLLHRCRRADRRDARIRAGSVRRKYQYDGALIGVASLAVILGLQALAAPHPGRPGGSRRRDAGGWRL